MQGFILLFDIFVKKREIRLRNQMNYIKKNTRKESVILLLKSSIKKTSTYFVSFGIDRDDSQMDIIYVAATYEHQ